MNNNFTFSKKERLCSRKVIATLFENGNSFYSDLFRVLWLESNDRLPAPALTAISVGKKTFPSAVSRNRVKRLVRETWRINKSRLYTTLDEMNINIYIIFIYTGRTMPGFKSLEMQMSKLIEKFSLHLTTLKNNQDS